MVLAGVSGRAAVLTGLSIDITRADQFTEPLWLAFPCTVHRFPAIIAVAIGAPAMSAGTILVGFLLTPDLVADMEISGGTDTGMGIWATQSLSTRRSKASSPDAGPADR